ncbi:nucleotidyltransferase family protein [Gramella sp. GC03-9]|uniref:Nucleotidyltransferase family protein n=1 Tax=Christiangramia oceanisediminis TaxID=2920386 RepID=A0A9X2I5Q3_9FLAO|nr:nucleotidyltransferase family protein [Gramella oceanisediminis]MCP9199892.1 nucleotidyltransferase family protein [Gramella oceanisediminis]
MDNWKKLIIEPEENIRSAMQLMDEVRSKLLLVCINNKFKSVLSIGDIQRAILSNHSLDAEISSILRNQIIIASDQDNEEDVRNLMLQHRIEAMPVVDEEQNVIDVIFWDQIFSEKKGMVNTLPDIPVVIMAGGKGTRLKPITNIIPKPLIPLGDKPVLEWIIDSFNEVGVRNFHLTVNYKQDMIRSYFANQPKRDYSINYFEENKPLGTAGSLHLLKGKLKETFFVTNCDILIKDDYSEMLKYHKSNGNELTAVSAVKHFKIPYGTLEFGENGVLEKLKEKPEYNFFINAGMYILEPHLLEEIPEDEFFHITTLIEKIMERNGKVGIFPVSEGSWMDIGQWDEYNKTSQKLGYPGINL